MSNTIGHPISYLIKSLLESIPKLESLSTHLSPSLKMCDTLKLITLFIAAQQVHLTLKDHNTIEVFFKAATTRVESYSNYKEVQPLATTILLAIIAPINLAS